MIEGMRVQEHRFHGIVNTDSSGVIGSERGMGLPALPALDLRTYKVVSSSSTEAR